MTAIAAHQTRETPERPACGQVLPGEFFLRDGTPAMIWPLLSTDAETLREGFRRLSPDSRQRRFLAALNELDAPMIRLLVDSVDGVHHIALLLIALPPEGEEGPSASPIWCRALRIRPLPTSPSPSSTTGKDAAPARHSSRR